MSLQWNATPEKAPVGTVVKIRVVRSSSSRSSFPLAPRLYSSPNCSSRSRALASRLLETDFISDFCSTTTTATIPSPTVLLSSRAMMTMTTRTTTTMKPPQAAVRKARTRRPHRSPRPPLPARTRATMTTTKTRTMARATTRTKVRRTPRGCRPLFRRMLETWVNRRRRRSLLRSLFRRLPRLRQRASPPLPVCPSKKQS
jgi:hypothetical protein